MRRRADLGWRQGALLLALLLPGCGDSSLPALATEPPRNVILISLDTLRFDHLGLAGYHRDTSPRLDAFARESIVFEHAVAQSTSTLPSHRSFFQSRISSQTNSEGLYLAEIFKASGYQTVALTGGGNISKHWGFAAGFDRYDEDPRGLDFVLPEADLWLDERDSSPFLLFLHTYDIHLPYNPPPPYDQLFYPDYAGAIDGPGTLALVREIRGLPARMNRNRPPSRSGLNDQDKRQLEALYDGGIRKADDQLGHFLARLKESGLLDQSVVVLFSDHGEEFWEHGTVSHSHSVYQELVQIPLIIRLPNGHLGGTRIKAGVRLMDVAPTLLELMRIEIPEQFRGRSLLPLMEGRPQEPRALLSEMEQLRGWTEYPFKLIVGAPDGPMLFDLSKDPEERKNLAGAQPRRVAQMRLRLQEELGEHAPIVKEMDADTDDDKLRDQLRALGYID